MSKVFAYFMQWCREHRLPADQYRITITPLTADAEYRLRVQWMLEMDAVLLGQRRDELLEGNLYGIPFKIAPLE